MRELFSPKIESMFKAYLIITVALLFSLFKANGQCNFAPYPCIDSTGSNIYYQCPGNYNYNPQCGCDGNTYINDCDMQFRHGVCYAQASGPCGDFHFDIYPTLTDNTLYLSAMLKSQGTGLAQIYDAFGHQMYSNNFSFYSSFDKLDQFQIDVSTYELGM